MTDHIERIMNGKGIDFERKNGYSRENIRCDEFAICAEARESFENFDRYCTGKYEACPHRSLTTDVNDKRILEEAFELFKL